MEHHKISKSLNDSTASKFVIRKWIELNYLLDSQYSVNRNIRFKIPMLRSDLCDYNDAYFVVKGKINLRTGTNNDMSQKDALKDNAPFRSCITKIYGVFIDNTEDLDIVMPMYNLLEYSDNYYMTSGSLWNYYRDEIDDAEDDASNGKSFKYKIKVIGKTEVRPPQPPQAPPNPVGSQQEQPPQPPVPLLNTEVIIRLNI